MQFSPHEAATQKCFSPPFSISLHFYLSSFCCLHNVHPVFECPEADACSLDGTNIVHKTLTVPVSCGEKKNFLFWLCLRSQ